MIYDKLDPNRLLCVYCCRLTSSPSTNQLFLLDTISMMVIVISIYKQHLLINGIRNNHYNSRGLVRILRIVVIVISDI